MAKCFAAWSLQVTFDVMLYRLGELLFRTKPRIMRVTSSRILGATLLALLAAAGPAWPQTPLPPSPSSNSAQPQADPDRPAPEQSEPAPPPTAPPGRDENPGLLNEMGKLFDKSRSMLPTLKSPSETFDDWNARAKDATKNAGDSLTRFAKPSSSITGRMGCPIAPNGAPDCKAAADKLCQTKGFKEGKSLDVDSAEKCSAKVYFPGYKRQPGDCRTENYVTRALCQ